MMALTAPHVLLVEDDPDTREVLRIILESDGMVVTPAHDGLDALERLDEIHRRDPSTPCAIVLDYMMPRFGGAQFRARQLSDPETSDVPVILVSAISDLENRAAALRPFAVLQKPVDPDELTALVRQASEDYLNSRQHQQR
jgi:two-component system, OmpR family, phosphate regulon response regulator PhoB